MFDNGVSMCWGDQLGVDSIGMFLWSRIVASFGECKSRHAHVSASPRSSTCANPEMYNAVALINAVLLKIRASSVQAAAEPHFVSVSLRRNKDAGH